MLFNFKSKKLFFVILVILGASIFFGLWNVVSGGYDKQNKIILFLKELIPSKVSRKVRDTLFIVPDLKERNKFLSLQVEKYEQGLDGKLFREKVFTSQKNKRYHWKSRSK